MKSFVLSAALFAAAALSSAASAQAPAPSSSNQQIWCYVEADRLLSRKWPSDCKGKIVSDAEAKQIQQERARRVAGSIQGAKPLFANQRQVGTGSGMFVTTDGHVLTNNHVIDHCDAFSVTPAADGKAVPAQLIAAAVPQDLALLKTAPAGHTVAYFRETEPGPATDIAVVGYPLLGRVVIKPIYVEGSVYAGRSPSPERFMINMDVRSGNSGGPTIDRAGNIVGIVVAKVNTPAVYANTGKAVFELGFSIRPQVALAFMRANGVSPQIASGAVKELDREPLFALATKYVAQIGCWK